MRRQFDRPVVKRRRLFLPLALVVAIQVAILLAHLVWLGESWIWNRYLRTVGQLLFGL
jgi:hypothetical protein